MSSLLGDKEGWQTRKVDRTETKHGMLQPILMCGWRYVQNWKSLL